MNKPDTMNIEIKSMLTTNLLIELPDKTYFPNQFGDVGCLIAEALMIDNDKKLVKRLRFESEQFPVRMFSTERWLDFDKKVKDQCLRYIDKFTDASMIPNKIMI